MHPRPTLDSAASAAPSRTIMPEPSAGMISGELFGELFGSAQIESHHVLAIAHVKRLADQGRCGPGVGFRDFALG